MLNSQEKSQLRAIVNSNQWVIVEKVAQELCQKIMSDSQIHESEWQLIQDTLKKQGKVEGVRKLINELQLNCQ